MTVTTESTNTRKEKDEKTNAIIPLSIIVSTGGNVCYLVETYTSESNGEELRATQIARVVVAQRDAKTAIKAEIHTGCA